MMERWLQITCDGCGETESGDTPNDTAKNLRDFMKRCGWQNFGRLDYCRQCVADKVHLKRESMFGS